MSTHHLIHSPTYEGEEDPRQHSFVYKRMWDAVDVTDDEKILHILLVHSEKEP